MSYGPFRDGCVLKERSLYLAELRALVRVIGGPKAAEAAQALSGALAAPGDPNRLRAAHSAFEALPAKTRRHVLATFAALRREGPHAL
jgi:hypothetical protein